jgi:hypothetical protein
VAVEAIRVIDEILTEYATQHACSPATVAVRGRVVRRVGQPVRVPPRQP